MTKLKTIICTIIILSTSFLSCDKLPENGDLDGLWQLMEIDEGGITKKLKENRIYCSFQLKLFMLGTSSNCRAYFGKFERNNNQIRFYSFSYRSDYSGTNQSEDVLMTDEKDLDVIAPWGFYSTDCTYDIDMLSRKTLILRHDNKTITYRKM